MDEVGSSQSLPFDEALEVVARVAGADLARLLAGLDDNSVLRRVTDSFVSAETDLVFITGDQAVHIEMQARADHAMAGRMLLYAGLLVGRERFTQLTQFELVVRSDHREPQAREVTVGLHTARWTRQPIASLDISQLTANPGLLPLATATGQGVAQRTQRLRYVLRQVLELADPSDRTDLLVASYILAQPYLDVGTIDLVFTEEQAMSLLEHSPLAEHLAERFSERFVERGRNEGRNEGRSALLGLVDKFGNLPALRALADMHGWDAVQDAAPGTESLAALQTALAQRPT